MLIVCLPALECDLHKDKDVCFVHGCIPGTQNTAQHGVCAQSGCRMKLRLRNMSETHMSWGWKRWELNPDLLASQPKPEAAQTVWRMM